MELVFGVVSTGKSGVDVQGLNGLDDTLRAGELREDVPGGCVMEWGTHKNFDKSNGDVVNGTA